MCYPAVLRSACMRSDGVFLEDGIARLQDCPWSSVGEDSGVLANRGRHSEAYFCKESESPSVNPQLVIDARRCTIRTKGKSVLPRRVALCLACFWKKGLRVSKIVLGLSLAKTPAYLLTGVATPRRISARNPSRQV